MTKRYAGLTVACFFSMSLAIVSAGNNTEENKAIQDIRTKCVAINSDKEYEKVQIDVMDKSAEGGVAVGYFDEAGLKKLTLKLFGEMGNSISEYYFDGKRLIFIYSQDRHYKYPLGYDKIPEGQLGLVDHTEEQRSYFQDSKLIRLA